MIKKKKRVIISLLIIVIFVVAYSIVFWSGTISKKVNEDVVLRFNKSFQYSTEGASLVGSYGDNNKIEYLSVDIMGELGREIYEYTFGENYIVLTYYEIHYSEPFYLSDGNIKIEKMENYKYIMLQNEMYEISANDELIKVSEERFAEEKAKMQDYVNKLEENGKGTGSKIFTLEPASAPNSEAYDQ